MSIEVKIVEKPEKNTKEEMQITTAKDILNIKDVQAIRNAIREHLIFIGLDRKNNIRDVSLLGIGSTCNVVIDTKEILRNALFTASEKVILVHNHPSNNIEPSKDDIHLSNITQKIMEPFHIQLLDHIIVTENDYLSMESEKKFEKKFIDDSLLNMSKGLLLEENERLKKQLENLQNKLKLETKVVSAKYLGNYNDVTIFSVEILKNGNTQYATLEKFSDGMNEEKWEVFSNLDLDEEDISIIIDVVSKNPPAMLTDVKPKIYENLSMDEIELGE